MMKIWLVLPAYNEADNLPAIFDDLKKMIAQAPGLSARVVVVDDGSADKTVDVSRNHATTEIPVDVIKNEVNRGLAITFMRGVMAAAEQSGDDDVIVTMDADNSHLPGQVPHMLLRLQEGRDVVIASRYREGAVIRGVPAHRLLLSRVMSILFQVVYPVPGVRDYSCGYRAYRASFLKRAIAKKGDALFSKQGFDCMVAILLRLHKLGAVCGEIPLVLRYDQKIGASKMKVGKTVLRTIGVLIKERFS